MQNNIKLKDMDAVDLTTFVEAYQRGRRRHREGLPRWSANFLRTLTDIEASGLNNGYLDEKYRIERRK